MAENSTKMIMHIMATIVTVLLVSMAQSAQGLSPYATLIEWNHLAVMAMVIVKFAGMSIMNLF